MSTALPLDKLEKHSAQTSTKATHYSYMALQHLFI